MKHEKPFIIGSVNLRHGAIAWDHGRPDFTPLSETVAALRKLDRDSGGGVGWHVLTIQELAAVDPQSLDDPGWDTHLDLRRDRIARDARRQHAEAQAHLQRITARLGAAGVLGPPVPGSSYRLYTAVLVRKSTGIEIAGTGPAPAMEGNPEPAWCQARLKIGGIPHPVSVYGPHFPARSVQRQLVQAESLVSLIHQQGELAVVAGDINGIPRSDDPSGEALLAMPPHLRPARMVLDDGPLRPDCRVDDTLTRSGMVDIAVRLHERGIPVDLGPTGHGGSRVDREYATEEMARAVTGYRKFPTGGDHDGIAGEYDRAALAEAVPPGYRH